MRQQFLRRSMAAGHGLRIGLAIVGLLLASAARAAPDQTVEELIQQGVRLRVQGRHGEALELFSKANTLAPSAHALAQVGLAEASIHRWSDAETHLAAALALHGTPWIDNRRNREALTQALSSVRKHIGDVNIIGPAGAEVTIDGKRVGQLPLQAPLRLAEGAASFAATAPGHLPAAGELTVTGDAESTFLLQMSPLPPTATAPAAPSLNFLEREAPGDQGGWRTWTGVSLAGVSAAALVTGIVWIAIDGTPTCRASQGAVCDRLYDTKVDGWAMIGTALAAGIGGGILIWQGRRADAHVEVGLGTAAAVGHF